MRISRTKGVIVRSVVIALLVLILQGCDNYFTNDYRDNSPTSGKLNVFYDEGLQLHVENQIYTFNALYHNAEVKGFCRTESQAVQGLYKDSCEAIVMARLLNDEEKKAFASKRYTPLYSHVASTGVALIVSCQSPLYRLTVAEVQQLLKHGEAADTLGVKQAYQVVFDANNSSVLHYTADSILKGTPATHWASMRDTRACIDFVTTHTNAVGFIDFAWLSDSDDSLYKANTTKLRFLAIGRNKSLYDPPHQSSFKLGTYPFTRHVYVIRKTGEFTLAKGFESFVAGPKGQLTFLKQGLLPAHQGERSIEMKVE
jgi:ABC-type phosphate transport system substrate-binding protein